MARHGTGGEGRPTRKRGEPPEAAPPLYGSTELLAAYGMFFAEAALSGVRHELLNRMTALGALSFELGHALPVGQEPSISRQRLADLNRQIAATTTAAARRMALPTPGRETCAVEAVIARLIDAARWPGRIATTAGPPLRARIAPLELAIALLCLIDNAVEATTADGATDVTVGQALDLGGRVAITVEDRGGGLADADHFERFQTTKEGHAGLGLCVARLVAERWQGEVGLAARPGGGACATFVVPSAVAKTDRRAGRS